MCCRESNEVLPTLTHAQIGKADTTNEAHYYFTLTFPGVGVLACVAMRSGSRNVPDQEHRKFRYWYERLEELGLVPEDDPELPKTLANTKWQVHFTPHPYDHVVNTSLCDSVHNGFAPSAST